ncbi:MAG: hypothetical protein AUI15_26745 [Actinobacteria bacterium 13_2_20CM_2_66_6]|nr:MAG: hypothetical protein AUI15_26745 [Actinobacteria bacterium 13_2_20CM_2_66_6]
MKEKVTSYSRSQRSQGLTEFAIIAPIILLLTFGIIDFGRALYLYITLQQAANEGARVAVRASYFVDPNGATHTWPTDSDVATAITGHAVIMKPATGHPTVHAVDWAPTRRPTLAPAATSSRRRLAMRPSR